MAIIIRTQIQMDSATRGLKKIQDSSDKVKKNIDALNDSLKITVKLISDVAEQFDKMRGGRISAPRSGGGGSSGGSSRGSSFIGPPMSDYQKYAARRDATAANRAQYNKEKGIGNPSSNPIMNLLMRSRIDSTGNLMPLVMDIAKILGPEVTAVAAVAIEAIKVGQRVMNDADELLKSYKNAYIMGGGTPGQARAASRIAAATGVDVSGVGRNLMSGYGPIAAAGAGVNPFGGPFGDINYTEKGLKILDYIRSSKNFDEARRRAELAGSPEAAGVKLLSQPTYDRLRSTEQGQGSESNIRGQAEFQANMAIISDAITHFEIAAGGPALKFLAETFGELSDAIEALQPILPFMYSWVQVLGAIASPLKILLDILEGLHIIGPKHDNHDALKDNTKSLDNLTRSINQGIYGGGPRAQLPGAQNQKGYFNVNPVAPYGVL